MEILLSFFAGPLWSNVFFRGLKDLRALKVPLLLFLPFLLFLPLKRQQKNTEPSAVLCEGSVDRVCMSE